MAERRMFAKTIIDSDAFIDMPVTARLLYYDLAMRADDDGFVNSPKKIMRMIGASQDDLSILIMRKFILPFDNGVVVIKHWRIHNYIRKDTYNETPYTEQKALLEYDENKAYRFIDNEPSTNRQQAVNEPSTQVRLGKDSLVKVIDINNNMIIGDDREPVKKPSPKQLEAEFEDVWLLYPRKQGKQNALKAYIKARKAGTTAQEVVDGLNAYVDYIRLEKVEERYVKQGSTWFNQCCWNDDYTVHRKPTTKDIAENMDFSEFMY